MSLPPLSDTDFSELKNRVEALLKSEASDDVRSSVRATSTAHQFTPAQQAELHDWLAGADWIDGAYDKASTRITKAIELARSINNRTLEARFLKHLGQICSEAGNDDEGIQCLKDAGTLYSTLELNELAYECMHDAAMILLRTVSIVQARELSEQIVVLAKLLPQPHALSAAYSLLATTYSFDTATLPTAKKYLERSLEIAEAAGDSIGVARALHNLASIHTTWNNYDQAEKNLTRSLQLSKEAGSQAGMSVTHLSLGRLRFIQERFEDAVEFLKKGIEFAKAAGHWERETQCEAMLGTCYVMHNQHEIGRKHLRRANENFTELNKRESLSSTMALAAMALSLSRCGQHDEALKYHQEATTTAANLVERNSAIQLGYQSDMEAWLAEVEQAAKDAGQGST